MHYCDSYAEQSKLKDIHFTDKNGLLLQIKMCPKCFQEEFNLDWNTYEKYSNYNIEVEFSKEITEELTFLCCAYYSKKYLEIFVEL